MHILMFSSVVARRFSWMFIHFSIKVFLATCNGPEHNLSVYIATLCIIY
jgi:hypothetical protein